jgi:hypothetical protein
VRAFEVTPAFDRLIDHELAEQSQSKPGQHPGD